MSKLSKGWRNTPLYQQYLKVKELNLKTKTMKQNTTKQPDSKEGLPTQENRDLENLVSELRTYNLRRFTCINDSGYSQVERDIVYAITKPYKDERKALLDALKKVNEQIDLHLKHKELGIGWLETAKETIQTALNNAKNI